MHLAMVIDDERLEQEQPLLHRLCVGLMGDGVQVTRIVPDSIQQERIDQGEQRIALAARIQTPLRVLPWMRSDRLAKLLGSMERSHPDVVYAVGVKAWPIAGELAHALDRPLLIDVWSVSVAESMRHVSRHLPSGVAVAGFIAPCEGIAEVLRRQVDPALVAVIPMGVPVPAEPHPVMSHPDAACLAVLGRCRDVAAYQSLLGGLSRVLKQFRGVQLVIELRGPGEHEIWREAERLDLLGAVSAIGSASLYRDLLVGCDAIVMPEVGGELRSIMLECMAFGVPIVANHDPVLNMLAGGEPASAAAAPGPDGWATQLSRLLQDPNWSRSFGQRMRSIVDEHYRSSGQVERMVGLMDQVRSGGSLRFDGV